MHYNDDRVRMHGSSFSFLEKLKNKLILSSPSKPKTNLETIMYDQDK